MRLRGLQPGERGFGACAGRVQAKSVLVASPRIVPAADVAAWTDAQGLLAAARAQAQAIVASAQEQLAQERARGYAEGVAEAKMEQMEKMIETVGRTVEYFAAVENDVVALVRSNSISDIYGKVKSDPIGWGYTNATAVRKPGVSDPLTVWATNEWTITAGTNAATPKLAVTNAAGPSGCGIRSSSTRERALSATITASPTAVTGRSITNSSPP